MAKELSMEDTELIKTSPIVIVADTETTGFSPEKGASLIEIGAVKLDVEQGKILQSFSSLIRPMLSNGKVPKNITELTKITEEDVADAPEQEIVLDHFAQFIGSYPIVFHNATFDWRFLSKGLEEVGIHPQNPILDTLPLSKYLFPEEKGHRLNQITERFGCIMEGHHRAVVDAKYTASVYLKLRDLLMENDQAVIMPKRKPIQVTQFQSLQNMRILQVRYWTGGGRKRIYVTTSCAVFYYDLNRKVWNVSDLRTEANLNYREIEPAVLRCLNLTKDEFLEQYGKNSKKAG